LYVSGVLFSIATLSIKTHRWIVVLLQLNPAALYITLVRNALLRTQRLSAPGAQPYDARLCHVWATVGHSAHATAQSLLDSAHCHYYANPDLFWYYAIGWAAFALAAGFLFFWRAEAKYGRG
jgi:teichoic acid transport system permease protein